MNEIVEESLNNLREEAERLIKVIDEVKAGKKPLEYVLSKGWDVELRRRTLKMEMAWAEVFEHKRREGEE